MNYQNLIRRFGQIIFIQVVIYFIFCFLFYIYFCFYSDFYAYFYFDLDLDFDFKIYTFYNPYPLFEAYPISFSSESLSYSYAGLVVSFFASVKFNPYVQAYFYCCCCCGVYFFLGIFVWVIRPFFYFLFKRISFINGNTDLSNPLISSKGLSMRFISVNYCKFKGGTTLIIFFSRYNLANRTKAPGTVRKFILCISFFIMNNYFIAGRYIPFIKVSLI